MFSTCGINGERGGFSIGAGFSQPLSLLEALKKSASNKNI